MDTKTRELIENILDEGIENLGLESSVRQITDWIMTDVAEVTDQNNRKFMKSAEDLAVGYVLGYLARLCHEIILKKITKEKIESALKNPIQEKIDEKGAKIIEIRLAKDKTETEIIRKMLKNRVPQIREEVIKGLNV